MASKISWFGGHMARTVRELQVSHKIMLCTSYALLAEVPAHFEHPLVYSKVERNSVAGLLV